MCLLVLAWRAHPRYDLIVAANRDEFHDRPAAPLAEWSDARDIVAGRDLQAGGTWLGAGSEGRFGVVTNFRDLQKPQPGAPSRGELIPAFLSRAEGPGAFFDALAADAARYSGFNLLLADRDALWYASNRSGTFARSLEPGVHGLSNELLESPWPKLLRVRGRFEQWLRTPATSSADGLFAMLADREPTFADEHSLQSKAPADLQRALSAPFVHHSRYGTRCSTVVLREPSGAMRVTERSFDAEGKVTGEVSLSRKDAAARWSHRDPDPWR